MAVRGVEANALYRTLWRWHFYAGLFVIPFIIILSLTGAVYLFKPQIESFEESSFRNLSTASGSGGGGISRCAVRSLSIARTRERCRACASRSGRWRSNARRVRFTAGAGAG
jgi:hypothetical protein